MDFRDREFNAGKVFTETTVEEKTFYRGRILNLRDDDVTLPGGKAAKRVVIEHRGGVAVLAVDENGYVPIVRQYRYPIGKDLWEIPAGKLEAGEDPDDAIRRELREEAGLDAGEVSYLGMFYPTCGYSSEIIRIYLARQLTYVGAHPDEDEFLEIKYVKVEELYEKCLSGEIEDGKTLIAVLKYFALARERK